MHRRFRTMEEWLPALVLSLLKKKTYETSLVKKRLILNRSTKMPPRCQDAPRCHQDGPKTTEDGPKMAPRGIFAAEPAREAESKSEHFARVLEGWGPSCTVKTICFMSWQYMRPRRSQGDDEESERAEKAPLIICGKKYPPGTLFERHFLKRPKNSHFILWFYCFQKTNLFRKMKSEKK